jgi:hypothetical protein
MWLNDKLSLIKRKSTKGVAESAMLIEKSDHRNVAFSLILALTTLRTHQRREC